jgi:hypothetical protein
MASEQLRQAQSPPGQWSKHAAPGSQTMASHRSAPRQSMAQLEPSLHVAAQLPVPLQLT